MNRFLMLAYVVKALTAGAVRDHVAVIVGHRNLGVASSGQVRNDPPPVGLVARRERTNGPGCRRDVSALDD